MDAVSKFPSASYIGQFHEGGWRDTYRVPKIIEAADCEIRVELRDATEREWASWSDIRRDMCDVIHTCGIDQPDWATVGGWTVHGDDDKLMITIGSSIQNSGGDPGVQTS